MDPIVAKLAEAVAQALARAAGALIGEKAKNWLKDRSEREAYERALAKALEDVGRQFPAIAASFFDEHFLQGPVAEELAIFFFRHRTPDPSRIAEAYSKRFSASHIDALNAAEHFLVRAEEHMKDEGRQLWKPLRSHGSMSCGPSCARHSSSSLIRSRASLMSTAMIVSSPQTSKTMRKGKRAVSILSLAQP